MDFLSGKIIEVKSKKEVNLSQLLDDSLHGTLLSFSENTIIRGNNKIDFFRYFFQGLKVGKRLVFIDPNTTDFEQKKIEEKLEKKNFQKTQIANQKVTNSNFLDYWENDQAQLMFLSSGTTNKPKGILHSYLNLKTKISHLRNHVQRDECQNALALLPISFGYGLISGSLLPLSHGANLYLADPHDITTFSNINETIDNYEISFTATTPALWQMILKLSPPPKKKTLKFIMVAASPLNKELQNEIQTWAGDQCKVYNVYGSTETCGVVSGPTTTREYESNYIGSSWSGEMKISETGELLVKTPALYKGYEIDGKFIAQTEPWFQTGDFALKLSDGFLLKGRIKNMINKGGIKIYPIDIETIAHQHSAVADCVALGIDDQHYGEVPVLAYTLESNQTLGASELHQYISKHFNKNKCPTKYLEVKEIPKNSRGKVDVKKVRSLFENL